MSVPARLRPLPGAPRWALAVVAVLAALEVGTGLVPGLRAGPAASTAITAAHMLLVLTLNCCLCGVLTWRARSVPHERLLWRRLALAAVSVSGPSYRLTPESFPQVSGRLLDAAADFSRRLGHLG